MNRDVGNLRIYIAGHLPGLERISGLRINRMIEGPQRCTGVDGLKSQQIFPFTVPAAVVQPEILLHTLSDKFGFLLIVGWVFAQEPGKTGGQQIVVIIIRRGIGNAPAAVLQIVACPDCGVCLIQRQVVRPEGPPEKIAANKESLTGDFLREELV